MSADQPSWLRFIPNGLTLLRIALIPALVFFLIDPGQTDRWIAAGIFVAAALTDFLDGFLARRWDVVSDFGKLCDPFADKALVMSALVMLVAQRSDVSGEPWVPGWLVVLILAREMWMNGLRSLALESGILISAGLTGKIKTAAQMTAIPLIILHDHVLLEFELSALTCQVAGLNLLVGSVIIAYWGAIEYTVEYAAERRRQSHSSIT